MSTFLLPGFLCVVASGYALMLDSKKACAMWLGIGILCGILAGQ